MLKLIVSALEPVTPALECHRHRGWAALKELPFIDLNQGQIAFVRHKRLEWL